MDIDNYYFTNLTQTDFKMILPQSLLNFTLPMKLIAWYKSFIDVINKVVK